ncbi:MAG: polynucleotide adenylyltransferase [Erythrobacter sp. RIFCSPHIGHO2_12_FULL_63_10]|nr:MAG: polynucleotide adenylyltransferase [Erythrobacter sp. RIFCSPHIGHO2_12_FULL_63_10]
MRADLTGAGWPARTGLKALTRALGADNIRWVGGVIRDSLLGQDVRDIDCATRLLPDAVIDRCREAGIRTIPTGIEHGTVTALLVDGTVEITTLRRDVSTDGRRATIAFADDWREDAARRDFTINALYAHPETLEISDYFGGLHDLRNRRVRFIGDARQRIREDHLRILRYFRFQARFGADPDEEAESACAELAATLKGLSRERVAMELLNLLGLPAPLRALQRMKALGVLDIILPEACQPGLAALERLLGSEHAAGVPPEPIRRLAAILPPHAETAEAVAARLRLSRGQRAKLISLAEREPSDLESPKALAYCEGLGNAIDRILLQQGDVAVFSGWEIPQFPLKGGQIIARGVTAGPRVAGLLRQIEQSWINEGFPDQDRVRKLLDEALTRENPSNA